MREKGGIKSSAQLGMEENQEKMSQDHLPTLSTIASDKSPEGSTIVMTIWLRDREKFQRIWPDPSFSASSRDESEKCVFRGVLESFGILVKVRG